MKIILPVEQPPITTYPFIANSFSMLWLKKDKTLPWICNHFIQLTYRPNHPDAKADFYDNSDFDHFITPLYLCPFLGWLKLNRETMGCSNFTNYVEKQITNGYYIEACLDNYYLSCSNNYLKNHFIHSTFIYGFDHDNQQIFISDFYDNGAYSRKIVSYDEVNQGINTNNYFIILFKYEDFDYNFNIDLLSLFLNDYVEAKDSLRRFCFSSAQRNQGIKFGIEIYDYIKNDLSMQQFLDIRPFHILYDHKKLMKIRINYLYNSGYLNSYDYKMLNDNNNALLNKTLILRNKVIKYNITNRIELLSTIIENIKLLKDLDYQFFRELAHILV